MLAEGHLIEGDPHLIHPSMGVVKAGDLKDRLLAQEAIGQPSQHTEPHQVDLLNLDLERARASLPAPPHAGTTQEGENPVSSQRGEY